MNHNVDSQNYGSNIHMRIVIYRANYLMLLFCLPTCYFFLLSNTTFVFNQVICLINNARLFVFSCILPHSTVILSNILSSLSINLAQDLHNQIPFSILLLSSGVKSGLYLVRLQLPQLYVPPHQLILFLWIAVGTFCFSSTVWIRTLSSHSLTQSIYSFLRKVISFIHS